MTVAISRKMIAYVRQIVPEYNYRLKGLSQYSGRTVMIYFGYSLKIEYIKNSLKGLEAKK
jgi:hypothetical protein